MNKRKCCRAVYSALETAQNQSNGKLMANELTKKRIESACSIIDVIVADGEIELMQTIVSPAGLSVILECDFELSISNDGTCSFFRLIRKFDKFSFSKVRDDRLRITLTMNNLWVK